jgi:NADH:ubiquinone oxidoreductase subunit H
VYALAPIASVVPAFLAFAVVPFGDTVRVAGRDVMFQLADLNVGLLFFLAMGSLSVYGIALAGWSSGSKYPLLGAVRSSAQMISYEIALGLSVIPVVLYAGTLSTRGIVEAQQESLFGGGALGFLPGYFGFVQIPAFVMFLLAAIAETNRAPFDLPEAETELVAGYHTEYSGVKFALFFLAEYIHVVTVSAMAVTLFWGGWLGPRFGFLPWAWPLVWFVLKTSVFVFLFFWMRASMPRPRRARTFAQGTPAVLTGQWTTRSALPSGKVDAVVGELVEATSLLRIHHRAHRLAHGGARVDPDLGVDEDLQPREAAGAQLLVRAAGAPALVRVRPIRLRREVRLGVHVERARDLLRHLFGLRVGPGDDGIEALVERDVRVHRV